MSRCKSCKAEIHWTKTSKGRSMPMNAEPDPEGLWIIEKGRDDALLIRVVPDGWTGNRHTTHFATCPNAKGWRNKR